MATRFTVQKTRIEGAAELERALRQLPSKIGEQVLTNALRAGGRIVQAEAKLRAPVGSGKLRDSIIVRKRRRRRGAALTVQVGPSGEGFYGMFLEFGTRSSSPRPWLRPAFDATKEQALDKIGDSLGKAVEKAAVRLAGPLAKSGLVRRR